MKYSLFALLSCVAVTTTFAQKEIQIKIYQNTDYFKVQYTNTNTQTTAKTSTLNFNRISLAVGIKAKRNVKHEIEFFIPEQTKPIRKVNFPMEYQFREDTRFESIISTYSIRYEVSKLFAPSRKLFYSMGVGFNPYYVNTEYVPTSSTAYYRSDKTVGLSVNAIPQIMVRLNNKITADFSIPIKLYDLRGIEMKIENPAIPIRQQQQSDVEHIFFEPTFTARLGLAYTF